MADDVRLFPRQVFCLIWESQMANSESFRFGSIVLNAGTLEVTCHGEPVPLPPLSLNLLLVLARNAPNVVTTRQLEDEVWSGLVVDRGTINKRVLLVRKALRDAGCEDGCISVVRGVGYRIPVPVERLDAAMPDQGGPPAATPQQELPVEPAPPKRRIQLLPVLAGSLALLALVLLYRHNSEPPHTDALTGVSQGNGGASPAPYTGSPSVAVLAFEDRSDSQAEGYLASGIASQVIELLGAIDGLQVASGASSLSMTDPDEPISSVAAKLGVDTLLQGSIHRFGEKLHVMVRLLDTSNGATLWSQSYDQHIEQLFEVQDDIAANVARVLRVQVSDSERPDSRLATTGNVEAFTHYLRGRALMDSRITLGVQGLQEAMRRFEEAVRLDPQFVRAHVGVASTQYLLSAYDPSLDLEEQLAAAEASARYALQLDPSSAEALGVLAAILFRRGEALQSAALFNRARELGNRDPNFIHWHALLFTSMGYFEELVPGLEEAFRVDPLNPLLGCSLGAALSLSGQPRESVEVFAAMTPFSRRDLGLAMASIYVGDFDTARDMLRGIELWTGELPAPFADRLVDALHDPVQFQSVESEFLQAVESGALPGPLAFEALLILGSPAAFDLEIDFAGTPFQYRLPEPVWNNWGVQLRQDPRFKSWIRALGYDQYWRRNGWPDRCSPTSLDDFECI